MTKRALVAMMILVGCGTHPLTSDPDSGLVPDSGEPVSDPDSGSPDSGEFQPPDSGIPDSGTVDQDAGAPDSGTPPPCGFNGTACCVGGDPCPHTSPGKAQVSCDTDSNVCINCGGELEPACKQSAGDPIDGCWSPRVLAYWAIDSSYGNDPTTSTGCVTPSTQGVLADGNGNHQCGVGSEASPTGTYEYACIDQHTPNPLNQNPAPEAVYCLVAYDFEMLPIPGGSGSWGYCP